MKKRVLSAVLAAVMIFGFFSAVPVRASAITLLTASDECIEFIKQIEGFHAIPYWDYAQWTVGFGSACPEEDLERYQQEGIPVEEAEKLLEKEMYYFNREVNKFMNRYNLQLSQQQFDALFSLSYNIGQAWMYNTNHNLVQAIVNGAPGNELIYLMGLRCNAGGEFKQGLFRRRLMEADMYLNGRYNTKLPADYGTVTYDSGDGYCEATAQGYDMHLPARPMAVPTYEGYHFLGWYTQPTGGVPVTELNTSTNGMTLYAHWEKIGVADNIGGIPVTDTVVTVQASMLNVRIGPGITYSIAATVPAGTQLRITAIANRNGTVWGKCSQGWISLAHTDYQPETSEDQEEEDSTVTLPMDATVMTESGVTVHNGPHISYPQLGMLEQGVQIQVLELREFFGQQWARFEGGWVRAERYLMLHDEKLLAHPFVATVTNTYLNVRHGPGTSYSLAGTLAKDEQVQILAVDVVEGTVWGRCYKGWISLSYTDFDQSLLSRYRNHTYTDWTLIEASTCTQQGQEQRNCLDCDHTETRPAALKPHEFGDWYELLAPTDTEEGLKRRDCQICGNYETEKIDALKKPELHIFGTVTGCKVLNVRAAAGANNPWVGTLKQGDRVEIFEQTTVNGKVWGRCEKGWICITGYVTLEEVVEDEENRNIMTVTAYHLNIRAGAGSGYAVVGVLSQGDQVEVLETKTVDGKTWARIDRGWVSMAYLQ